MDIRVTAALLLLLAPAWTNCSKDNPTSSPTAPTTPATTIQLRVTRVVINGSGSLTSIGETRQLTATATFSDGTTKDVTSDGRWQSGDTRVVTVSASGLVTVVGFGSTGVSLSYQLGSSTVGTSLTVTATPAGTFVMRGRVREPGAGGISGFRVIDTLSGRSLTTDSAGEFSFAELPSLRAHFKTEKDGFEPTEFDSSLTYTDLPVQHVVRLTVGETVKPPRLAPNDLIYNVGSNRCIDCRMIRVVVPRAGTVHVRVTWTSATKLNFYMGEMLVTGNVVMPGNAGELTADVPIATAGEVLMYVGMTLAINSSDHVVFTFETSM